MSGEPAYTPRIEYQCDSSTTHYMGCKCHEARRNEEIRLLSERAQEFTHQLRIFKDALKTLATSENRTVAHVASEALRCVATQVCSLCNGERVVIRTTGGIEECPKCVSSNEGDK